MILKLTSIFNPMNITDKAMLVSLSIRQWTARKYDRKITEEVNHTHQAKDAGRFNKLLIEKKRLSPIQSASNKIRIFHYENTLAWADEGDRLLPVANFFDYSQKINVLKAEFEQAVDEFIGDYDLIVKEAQANLNGLFNPLDYPRDIRDRFGIKFSFMPVPDSQDFRVTVSKDVLDEMKRTLNEEVTSRLDNATESLRYKIREQLVYMRDKLADPNSIFRDSLFGNVEALVDLAPKLNVTGNKGIENLTLGMRDILVDPNAVRQNVSLRANIVSKLNDLLAI